MLGASARGVREIRMRQTKGFTPFAGWTADDLAAHADDVFFAEDSATAIG
jgi:hypothetical protein